MRTRGIAANLLGAVFFGAVAFDTAAGNLNRTASADFQRIHPCPSTGRNHGPCPAFQVALIIPAKCYGPVTPENMQWLSVDALKKKEKEEADWCSWSPKR